MSTWRGGARPSAFPSHSSSSSNTPASTSSIPSMSSGRGGFNNLSSAFASAGAPTNNERGRGRGRGRGASRGSRGAGAGAGGNLSWRKPSDEATATLTLGTTAEEEAGAEKTPQQLADEAAKSAFAAFGDPAAFGAAGGAGQGAGSAFGAFGAAGAGGFGGSGAFGGSAFSSSSSSSTAFPPPAAASAAPSAFAPAASSSAFGSSAFTPAPAAQPLFRPPSSEEEEEPETEQELDQEGVEPQKRAPGQISTLEVLGEDSDARKKRFEATLPNNRYLELKPLREAARLSAIKSGLIPDPSKPMRLDEARDFEGTCEEMCPEWEREEREYQNNVDPLERYPGTTRIDPRRAVKAFHRPAAGNDQPLPSDVRPPAVLLKTLDYLFHDLLPTAPLATTHPFLRDRTRSVRQDFTVQNVRGESAVRANERIARYHILALGTLREQSGFSESQELEQLRKVLKSLNEFYDDARLSPTSPASLFANEPEFRAYNLLTHLRDPDIVWSLQLLPPSTFSHPLLQRALQLHRLAQRSNLPRGERASLSAFSRFFKLVADPQTPYLFACILSTHFPSIRRGALDALRGAFLKQHSAFPLRTLAKTLGCDDEEEARRVCEQFGVPVRADEKGRLGAEVNKAVVLKAATLKPHVSLRLVEAKRGQTSYRSVIDGLSSSSADSVIPIPQTPSLAHPAACFSFSAAPAPPAAAFSAPPAARPAAGFSFSPVPTPVPTPPPGVSPFAPSSTAAQPNGLNAAAPAFVPSFGGQPNVPAPVSPAAPSQAAASAAPLSFPPPAAFPTPAPTHSLPAGFSFAPSSSSSAPPAAAPTAPPPSFSFAPAPSAPSLAAPPALRAATTKPLRPSSLRTTVTAAPFVPSLSPSLPSSTGAPLISPRVHPSVSPVLSSARRVSAPLGHPHPNAAQITSHITSAALARRKALVDALSRQLAGEILGAAVKGPVRRGAADALRERWAAAAADEREAKARLAAEVAQQAREEMEGLLVREVALHAVRDEQLRGGALRAWVGAARRSIERKEAEEERARRWAEVVKGLEGAKREREEDAELLEEEEEDEVVEMESEDEAGVAGDEDLDFGASFGGLSLAAPSRGEDEDDGRKARERDEEMAERVRAAATARSLIWARGTFLNLLTTHLSRTLSSLFLSFRPTYTALLSSPDPSAPFASWLACKFDLHYDPEDGRWTAEVDGPYAEVGVRMLGEGEEAGEAELDSTGLIIFDCTKRKAEAYDWTAARARLGALVQRAVARSLFAPAVLVVLCPTRTLSASEEEDLRTTVTDKLDLSSLAQLGVAASSVYITKLEGAERDFDVQAAKLLNALEIRSERVPRPLSYFLNPLVDAWRASLKTAYPHLVDASSAPSLVSAYLRELQAVIDATERVATPRPRARLVLPSFPTAGSPFSSAVSTYISQPFFLRAGNFPDIAVALSSRPPLAELPLARLVLEHLSAYVLSELAPPSARTTQGALDTELPVSLEHMEESLGSTEEEVKPRPAALPPAPPPKENGNGLAGKKRRASAAPAGEELSPKKPSHNGHGRSRSLAFPRPGQQDGERIDRLSALEGLLKEARGLLAR
ncbi:actin cytoskeleton and mitosis protein [Rhodosporidiobolus nylandii]